MIKTKKYNTLPDAPLCRVIQEGSIHLCDKCGSTMSRDGLLGLFGDLICDNEKCLNSKSNKK